MGQSDSRAAVSIDVESEELIGIEFANHFNKYFVSIAQQSTILNSLPQTPHDNSQLPNFRVPVCDRGRNMQYLYSIQEQMIYKLKNNNNNNFC